MSASSTAAEASTASEALAAAAALKQAEALLESRRLAHAVLALNHAEFLGAAPDQCSAGRWLAAMLHGDWSAAWRECDAIRARGGSDPDRFWQGEDFRGKRVVLRCLHGFGDAVQFLSYAPLLCTMASKLIVEVAPAMLEIAQYFDGVDEVITWGEQAPAIAPEWDVQMEINELPYVFRTRIDDLPVATNYLHLPASTLREVTPQPNSPNGFRIGLVWACGEWNPGRSIPIDMLRPLTRIPGCEFWNLQGGPPRKQWSRLGSHTHLHEAYSSCDTILKLAGLIAQLDLVITPDTLAAHLAGALGTRAWVMLQHASDWRWMHDREDSPWYPSVRLFRQPSPGDWPSLVRELQSSLILLSRSRQLRLVA